jgi:hypothetical protein
LGWWILFLGVIGFLRFVGFGIFDWLLSAVLFLNVFIMRDGGSEDIVEFEISELSSAKVYDHDYNIN